MGGQRNGGYDELAAFFFLTFGLTRTVLLLGGDIMHAYHLFLCCIA